MRKLIRRTSRKAGLPPGSLVHVGERVVDKAQISVLDYAADHVEEAALTSADQCVAFKDKPTVTWINITGLHDVDVLQRIGECYGIHPLALEDILNTQQRPKVEDFDDYLFVVLKMIDLAFAQAIPGGRGRAGYVFDDITYGADYTIDCGLGAAPKEFARSGRNLFIIDVTGVVYQKLGVDADGDTPPTVFDISGYIPVGSG